VTQPAEVHRVGEDSQGRAHLRPGKPNQKQFAHAVAPRTPTEVIDLRAHVSATPATNASQAATQWSVLLARYERANRVLNVVLATAALVVLSPLLVMIALAIKLTSRGPIFYTQIRVGRDHRVDRDRRLRCERRFGGDRRAGFDRRGRIERRAARNRRGRVGAGSFGRRCEDIGGSPIRIYKFRSMCVGAECGSGPVWATHGDARVTRVGRVLRQFRLDELPQLINVVKGEMNIVGPRPERPSIFSRLRTEIPDYPLRQRTRPGITGWAQIKHCYDSCLDDVRKKVGFDLEYLAHRSLWVDLRIMVKTIPVMVFRRGSQ
jgi:lipopolysaccharide/colanic/teichoic acid biosynthesis glycosyltransferase